MTQGFHMGLILGKNRGAKSHAIVSLKSFQLQKTSGGKKNYNLKLLHGQEYAENWGSEALKLRIQKKL
jgi:hypothetical protein